MTASYIDFSLYYEYLNDEDMARAHAAEKVWRQKQEALQAKAYGKIIRLVLDSTGVQRFLSWF